MNETNLIPDDGLKEINEAKVKMGLPINAGTQPAPIPIKPETQKQKFAEKDILGVRVVAPLYMIVTPCTHIEYSIKSMTVMMEEALRTSLTSKQSLIKMLASAIYDCIVEKPKHIETFDDFCKSISAADQVALFFGLIHQSYGEITDIQTACPKCDSKVSLENLSTAGLMDLKMYEGGDFLTKRVEMITDSGFKIVMRQPTLYDELSLFDDLLQIPNDKIGDLKEYLQNIEYIMHPQGKKLTSPTDLYMVISELNLKEGKQIRNLFEKAYGEFGCTFEHDTKCSSKTCGFSFKVEVNLFNQFFRMVQRS